jgi:hypothetical protein
MAPAVARTCRCDGGGVVAINTADRVHLDGDSSARAWGRRIRRWFRWDPPARIMPTLVRDRRYLDTSYLVVAKIARRLRGRRDIAAGVFFGFTLTLFGWVWWLALPLGTVLAVALLKVDGAKTRRYRRERDEWLQLQCEFLAADVMPIPDRLWTSRRSHATRHGLGLHPQNNVLKLRRAARQFGAVYRRPTSLDIHDDGTATLTIQHFDPLDKEPAAIGAGEFTPDRARLTLPVLRNADAELVIFALIEHSLLIAGQRGRGKTTFLNWLLTCLLYFYGDLIELYLFDFKEGMDLGIWHEYANEVVRTPEDALAMLERRRLAMKQRMAEMGRHRIATFTPTPERRARVIVLDEFASLLKDPKDKQRAEFLIGDINRLSRATGDILIAATQDTRKTIVTGELCAQFTHRLGLGVATQDDSKAILGTGAAGKGFDLSDIQLRHPGRCVWMGGDPPFEWGRCFRSYGDDLRLGLRAIQSMHGPGHGSLRPGTRELPVAGTLALVRPLQEPTSVNQDLRARIVRVLLSGPHSIRELCEALGLDYDRQRTSVEYWLSSHTRGADQCDNPIPVRKVRGSRVEIVAELVAS